MYLIFTLKFFTEIFVILASLIIVYCTRFDIIEKYFLFKIPIPTSTELDLVAMLTDDAMIATWNNEGLPSDKMSIENAAILTNCERWPLLIDPQLQAIKWIKNKYGTDLKIMTLGEKG